MSNTENTWREFRHTYLHNILAGGCGGESGQEASSQGQLRVKYKTDQNLSSFHQEPPEDCGVNHELGVTLGNAFIQIDVYTF